MCHAYDSDEGASTILWADQENKMANLETYTNGIKT
jgi:hypothetical protein